MKWLRCPHTMQSHVALRRWNTSSGFLAAFKTCFSILCGKPKPLQCSVMEPRIAVATDGSGARNWCRQCMHFCASGLHFEARARKTNLHVFSRCEKVTLFCRCIGKFAVVGRGHDFNFVPLSLHKLGPPSSANLSAWIADLKGPQWICSACGNHACMGICVCPCWSLCLEGTATLFTLSSLILLGTIQTLVCSTRESVAQSKCACLSMVFHMQVPCGCGSIVARALATP